MSNIAHKVALVIQILLFIPLIFLANTGILSATTIVIKSYISAAISDEGGGLYLVVNDYDAKKVYIQHLDSSGNPYWEGSGVTMPYSTSMSCIITDTQNGAIFVWDGIGGLYAQRVDNAGNLLWESDGVLVHKPEGKKWDGWLTSLAAIPDGNGGAIIVWQRLEEPNPIYIQRIDATGRVIWDANGIPVSLHTAGFRKPTCISDGIGGGIVVWEEQPGEQGDMKTFAQRFDNTGNLLWDAGGVQINDQAEQYKMIPDGESGAIVVFDDYRDISFIHLNSSGDVFWANDNSKVIHPKGFVYGTEILGNIDRSAYVVWSEEHSKDDFNLFAQKIDYSGNIAWGKSPTEVCTAKGNQYYQKVVSDNHNGFIVAWQDFRDNSRYIFAQRVDVNGNILWVKNGINLGRYYYPRRDFKMVANEQAGALIIREEGKSLEPRIFLQALDGNGISIEPETSLYPQGLQRERIDYEALVGSTSFFLPRIPSWIWLTLVGLVIITPITILTIFFLLKRYKRNREINNISN